MLSSSFLCLCVGVDNALIKGEIANTLCLCVQLVVMSDCQQRHFHSIFLFSLCFGYLHWHTAVCRAMCSLACVVQVLSCRSGSRRRGEDQVGRAVPRNRLRERADVWNVPCRVAELGKGGCEAWIEGPDRRVASRRG